MGIVRSGPAVRSLQWGTDDLMRSATRDAAPPVIVGADIGQKIDPTAIVVAEASKVETKPRVLWGFTARHLERLPLGTDYPTVAERIAGIVEGIDRRPLPANLSPPRIFLVVDATGVGAPVVDILRRRLHDSRAATGARVRLTAATFTHGDRLSGGLGWAEMQVGKAYLVSRLQALFQTERVRLPAHHPEAAAMTRELMDYEIRVDENANDRYGAFRVGSHDDLVTALGLAVLCDPPSTGIRTF